MILDEIVEDKKKRLPGHMARIPETEMRRMAEETKTREADCFYNHLKKPGLSIIGEFKKASPSLGTITSKIDLMERISEYNASVDGIADGRIQCFCGCNLLSDRGRSFSRKCCVFKRNPGKIQPSDFAERFHDL